MQMVCGQSADIQVHPGYSAGLDRVGILSPWENAANTEIGVPGEPPPQERGEG